MGSQMDALGRWSMMMTNDPHRLQCLLNNHFLQNKDNEVKFTALKYTKWSKCSLCCPSLPPLTSSLRHRGGPTEAAEGRIWAWGWKGRPEWRSESLVFHASRSMAFALKAMMNAWSTLRHQPTWEAIGTIIERTQDLESEGLLSSPSHPL